jgi:HAMP domain-containing protein
LNGSRGGAARHDPGRSGDRRGVDRRQADAARAEHRDGRAGLHPRGVHHRAVAGDDAAADQRSEVQRHVLADLHQRVLVHQHLLGERRQVGELVQVRAAQLQPLRDAGRLLDLGVLADRRPARQAELAVTAEHRQAGDDPVAGLHVGHVLADRLDDAGGLVAEHDRHGRRVRALDEVQVAVAQPGGRGADQHLAAARLLDRHVLDRHRLARRVQHGGLHRESPRPDRADRAVDAAAAAGRGGLRRLICAH